MATFGASVFHCADDIEWISQWMYTALVRHVRRARDTHTLKRSVNSIRFNVKILPPCKSILEKSTFKIEEPQKQLKLSITFLQPLKN